jgi:hypothetical protein
MNNFLINPIDLAPFIGASQTPEGRKRKLRKLYEAEAKEQLDKGDVEAYNSTMEKIKNLDKEENNN